MDPSIIGGPLGIQLPGAENNSVTLYSLKTGEPFEIDERDQASHLFYIEEVVQIMANAHHLTVWKVSMRYRV
jgi:hypothetical protein